MKVVVERKKPEISVIITTEFIKLEAAMKLADAVPSGGMAKTEIQEGNVSVNGEVCTMRGKKLYPGDRVTYLKKEYRICANECQ